MAGSHAHRRTRKVAESAAREDAHAHEHAHGHSHGPPPDIEIGRVPRVVLLLGLALGAVATLVGLFAFWPSGDREEVPYFGTGVTGHEASVVGVTEECPVIVADPEAPPTGEPPQVMPEHCNELTATLLDGPDEGAEVTMKVEQYVVRSQLQPGDTVNMIRIPGIDGRDPTYTFFSVQRSFPLALLTAGFVLAVIVVARMRGFLALVGLVFAAVVLAGWMLPALFDGSDGLVVALVGSLAIMYVVLYLAHGLSIRTSTALAGTIAGILVTAGLGVWGVSAVRLSGIDEENHLLTVHAPELDFKGLLICAVIVAGLGVLNDVTITQSSAVWELRAAAPAMPRSQIFASGMRIGRDHIASTIYTIVFVYAGTALGSLMLLSLYDRPILQLLSDEVIATEVVLTLSSAIGLVLAVPATTAIAALTVAGPVAPTGPTD